MFVLSSNMFESVFVLFFLAVTLPTYYRLRFHPLAHVPGPPLTAISSLFLYAICYLGIEGSVLRGYHEKYKTKVIRIGPTPFQWPTAMPSGTSTWLAVDSLRMPGIRTSDRIGTGLSLRHFKPHIWGRRGGSRS
jgi:hypothetical protein